MSSSLEDILKKAIEFEKKYEWLQAAKCYNKASNLVSKKNIIKKADFFEKEGHCYFKASYQANSNKNFVQQLEKSIEANNKILKQFQKTTQKSLKAKYVNAQAKIAYNRFWIEIDVIKKRLLIDNWWTLKLNVLKIYEKTGNKLALARTYNEILENSTNCKYWFGMNGEEAKKIRDELISFGEKAIKILTEEIENNFELARAYCWTSWYYTLNNSIYNIGLFKKEEIEKGLKYSKKALEISKKIEDKWLLSWSYQSAAFAANLENDLISAIKLSKRQLIEGRITKDHYLLGLGQTFFIMFSQSKARIEEDPEKKRKLIQGNIKPAIETINHFQTINLVTWNPYYNATIAFGGLSETETDFKTKYNTLSNAVKYGRKAIKLTEGWKHSGVPAVCAASILQFYDLSTIEKDPIKKQELLKEVLENSERLIKILEEYPNSYHNKANALYYQILAKANLADNSSDINVKISLFTEAISLIEIWLNLAKKTIDKTIQDWVKRYYGFGYYKFGKIYFNLFQLTNEKTLLLKSEKMYKNAIRIFEIIDLKTLVAESFWQRAIINNQLGLLTKSAIDYKSASETYNETAKKIPQLKDFYTEYSLYMEAWSQIEQARYFHSIEDYEEAWKNYEKVYELHDLTNSWSYLAPNYSAWANIEEAESLSRKENASEAKNSFQKALKQFSLAEESIKQKLEEITSSNEKEMVQRLSEASDLRRRYCQARISLEEAKLLDRKGKFIQSSQSYGKVVEKLGKIIIELNSEQDKREIKLIQVLSQAWQKMAIAQGKKSSENFLKAAQLFEKAKNLSQTEKTSLWALGNSSFCRGLAAGIEYQSSADLKQHAKAKILLKSASNSYLQAGFKQASEYAKATQRLFDAYAFMNQAENELDQQKRAKNYQMAENLLQIAAGSFMKAKQPEKTTQVQQILNSVREEKALAASLSQVMQAPTIASSTLSFSAPSSTNESSVGLESFEHANVQANLVTSLKEVKIGESFCLSVEFVNAGKEPALLLKVEDFVPSDFVVVKKPEIYRIEQSALNMKGKQIAPLKLVEVKLTLQPFKKGNYQLNPKVHYLDELGQNKSLQLKTLEIEVEEVLLTDRISTGTKELDALLLGGIPNEYAVVLTGSPSDEREFIIKNFLEMGIKSDEIVFYISTENNGLDNLLEHPNFILFLCNPKPKTKIPDLPNVYKLRSKTDLTNLSISLAKAYRNINQSKKKRICVETISDILLDYGTKATRKWISELITDLGAKGFTMIAVINQLMHDSKDLYAVLDLFDGEINITQSSDPLDCKKSIIVKKLRNQDYIKNPICLVNY